jgi:hypothetical protein
LNVTRIVHEFIAARLAPHVLVCAKSPLTNIPAMLTATAPSLVTFSVLGRLIVPILCALNFNFAGDTDNAPGVAVAVGVALTVAVAVRVAVGVAVGVAVAVAVRVLVAVAVAVRVGVELRAGVRADVAVAVDVAVADGVGAGVEHAAGVADATSLTAKICA